MINAQRQGKWSLRKQVFFGRTWVLILTGASLKSITSYARGKCYSGQELGIRFLEGHLQLGKDIVRGIKLKDITFTLFVRKLKGPATWPVGSVFMIQTDIALGRNNEWRRNFPIRTSFLIFNVKVSLAFLPYAATAVGQKPTEKTGENLPTRLLTSTFVSFFP